LKKSIQRDKNALNTKSDYKFH